MEGLLAAACNYGGQARSAVANHWYQILGTVDCAVLPLTGSLLASFVGRAQRDTVALSASATVLSPVVPSGSGECVPSPSLCRLPVGLSPYEALQLVRG